MHVHDGVPAVICALLNRDELGQTPGHFPKKWPRNQVIFPHLDDPTQLDTQQRNNGQPLIKAS